MKKNLSILLMGLALLVTTLSTGCATSKRFVTGEPTSRQPLSIQTTPPGASVKLSDGQTGTTPVQFSVARKTKNLSAAIELPGYVPIAPKFERKVGGSGIFGFVLDGGASIVCPPAGAIGFVTDIFITGAAYELVTNRFEFGLVPVQASYVPGPVIQTDPPIGIPVQQPVPPVAVEPRLRQKFYPPLIAD